MSDDLDQLIRKAASAHLALAPASVLTTPGVGVEEDDDLVGRAMRRVDDPAYLAQLAPLDLEEVMMSDPDQDPDRDRPGLAPSTTTDDSGLHDIRALAQTAKHRISRKVTAIPEVDDGLLATTTGQLKAIALPAPAMLVALPDLPKTADAELARETALKIEARGTGVGATAAAADLAALESTRPRKRTAMWLGIAGVAAAAAVVVVVATGGSKRKENAAGAGPVATTAPTPGPSIESADPSAGPGVATGAAGVATASETGTVGGPVAATPPTAPRADRAAAGAAADDRPRDTAREPRGGGSGSDADPKAGRGSGAPATTSGSGAGSGSAREPKPGTDPKGTGDKPVVDPKAGKGVGSGSAAPTGEKSIDDLLGDVGSKPPPPPGGGDGGPKPEKKGLDGKDIKAGMAPLAGKAQACYDQHGVAGHVKVKAIVDPSGKVTKVDATGEFAGTPTGGCVAAAVKAGASFPAWDGAPMTVNYSYTLNE